nr:MAG TPA: hypothetical protein [Caudoviricetes sp.]
MNKMTLRQLFMRFFVYILYLSTKAETISYSCKKIFF